MEKFICSFLGRKKGSLGNFYWYSSSVEAKDSKNAELKLYEEFDHIHHLKIDKVEKEEQK